MKAILLCAIAALICCRSRQVASNTAGVTQQTLRQSKNIPSPQYQSLIDESGTVRVNLFFAFAGGSWRLGQYTRKQAVQHQTQDQRIAHQPGWDEATQALHRTQRWFFDTQLNKGLFTCLQGRGGWSQARRPHYISRIKCQGPDFQGGKVTWDIAFHLSSADVGAPYLGQAMAAGHLTILSGHFYAEDVRRQERLGTRFSQVYGPALEVFGTQLKRFSHPYRIVIFNGCGSELIENSVYRVAKEQGVDQGLEMVANRGISNYGFFHKQIPDFFKGLAQRQNWADLISSFSMAQMGYDRSIPVFRDNDTYISDAGTLSP